MIIAGVGKSGTSSLHLYLDAHPEICMSNIKEPQFFSMDSQYEKGLEYHNSLFICETPSTKVFGESSTTYFASEVAMHRIKQSLKSPKIIIVLRDPVERTISHYRWLYALGLESRPFLQAIQESGYDFDPNESVADRWCFMSYLEFSLYSKWVPKWKELFGEENVLLLRSDDLKANPTGVTSLCCSFLEINSFGGKLHIEQNRTDDIRVQSQKKLFRALRSVIPHPLKRSIKLAVPNLVNKLNILSVRSDKIVPPQISESERVYLSELLNADLEFFSNVAHV